jgi:hypothetical protein
MIRYGLQWQALQDYLAIEETSNSSVWGEGATGTPPDNHIFIYAKDKSGTSALYFKNDAGTEQEIPTGIVTGSGVAGRVAFWSGTSALSSDADLTFSVDTLTATKVTIPTLLTATLAATFSFLTAGRVPYAGTAGAISDSDNLAWGNTNACLSLGGSNQDLAAVRLAASTNAGTDPRLMMLSQFSGDANGPQLNMHKSRGSLPTTHGAAQANDPLGGLFLRGDDGTTFYQQGARIRALAGSLWTGSNHESYIELATCPNASTSLAERFRVGASGQWGIGGATFGSSGDIFSSGGASAAPTWVTRATLNAAFDHNVLTNLATGDVHTHYVLLAGRAGGQTITGGTAAADDLTFVATSGTGVGSEQFIFNVGTNGGRNVMKLFATSAGTAEMSLNSGTASKQFNLNFQDNGTNKWIIYKTTTHEFSIWDAVNNDDVCFFYPTNAVPAAKGCVFIDPSISNANNTVIGLRVAPTMTGAGDGPWGFGSCPTFTPSASIGSTYANISQNISNPGSAITITSQVGAYYQCASTVSTGTITQAFNMQSAGPSYSGTTKPGTLYGVFCQNQGLSGITNSFNLYVEACSGSTNNYDMGFGTVDTTAAGAYYGRIPVYYNGLKKYIHVFSA